MHVKNENFILTLRVRDTHTSDPGWTNVTSDVSSVYSDRPYSYRWDGGNHPTHTGHIHHVVNQGSATITLRLVDEGRYTFVLVAILGDHQGQLASTDKGETSRVITNQCTKEMDAYYQVRVADKKTQLTLLCDPVIRNVPA